MEYVVTIDERGRIVIPAEVRRRLGIRGKRRVLLRVKGSGSLEIVLSDRIYEEVARAFEEKFKGWREEDHEASRLALRMVGDEDS